MPDIDIDFASRDAVLNKLKHVPARLKDRKHNTGVYTHKVPVNPFNGLCTVDYKEAESFDYFKLDFLNVSLYKDIRNEEHLTYLLDKEPIWELLDHKEFVEQLFHIGNNFSVVSKLKPRSIMQLAATIAAIRPAKRHLVDQDWDAINKEIWIKPAGKDSYYFKKAHAVAYASAIVVQMNMICEQLGY
jgi:hypothetical protein